MRRVVQQRAALASGRRTRVEHAAGGAERRQLSDAPLLHAVLHEDGTRRLGETGQQLRVARPLVQHDAVRCKAAQAKGPLARLEQPAVLLRAPARRADVEAQRVGPLEQQRRVRLEGAARRARPQRVVQPGGQAEPASSREPCGTSALRSVVHAAEHHAHEVCSRRLPQLVRAALDRVRSQLFRAGLALHVPTLVQREHHQGAQPRVGGGTRRLAALQEDLPLDERRQLGVQPMVVPQRARAQLAEPAALPLRQLAGLGAPRRLEAALLAHDAVEHADRAVVGRRAAAAHYLY